MVHFLKYVGLITCMWLISCLPFGMWANAFITFYALWVLVK